MNIWKKLMPGVSVITEITEGLVDYRNMPAEKYTVRPKNITAGRRSGTRTILWNPTMKRTMGMGMPLMVNDGGKPQIPEDRSRFGSQYQANHLYDADCLGGLRMARNVNGSWPSPTYQLLSNQMHEMYRMAF